jgi:uncharacterized membrane protein YqjE
MSKTFLIIIGILILVMGIMSLTVVIADVRDPVWHAVAKIVVGLIVIGVGVADKPKET